MRHLTKKNLRLIILTLLGIGCYILLRYNGKPLAPFIKIGNMMLPSSTISGILSGSLSLICLLLVFNDYKTGIKIGGTFIILSAINLLFGMIVTRSIVSMPGMVTYIVSLITLITIYSFYKKAFHK